ncbi:hypothetical protein [Staphylococcus chromogenes]|uniref:hypothetical protein n=1 Tax=Staphylococcus chromogenes TaxID=46126 RepID=UPI000D1A8DAE|nr:hypothetical protein [Staphylococcus chromogenes]PTG21711.1 hypothetical protein BU641_04975 [Staphylococcus chromogenes]
MVKIITKKKMNLPELIKWGWGNGVIYKTYIGSKGGEVYFNGFGKFRTERDIYLEETFEVEVEQKVDEETKIPVLVEVYKWDENTYYSTIEHNTSISSEKDEKSVAFYMINDDMTMTLLWRNGGMVE